MEKGVWSVSFSFVSQEARELFDAACLDFDDMAECVWKLNEQINNIWNTEMEKVASTSNPAIAASRYFRERKNVTRTFPLLLNYSFLATTFAPSDFPSSTVIVPSSSDVKYTFPFAATGDA